MLFLYGFCRIPLRRLRQAIAASASAGREIGRDRKNCRKLYGYQIYFDNPPVDMVQYRVNENVC